MAAHVHSILEDVLPQQLEARNRTLLRAIDAIGRVLQDPEFPALSMMLETLTNVATFAACYVDITFPRFRHSPCPTYRQFKWKAIEGSICPLKIVLMLNQPCQYSR